MKRLLYILFLCLVSFFVKGQVTPVTGGYPITQGLGSANAIVRTPGGALGGNFVVWRYTDTTAANLTQIKNYPFAIIATTANNSLWTRNQYATQWMAGSGTIDIDNFEFLNDSTFIICFSNGSCDTVSMTNFNTVVNNLIQNFLDSSITNIGDSILIICNQAGSCDTINIDEGDSYFFLNDSTIVVCDSLEIICVGDSCYQQQICDTIPIPVIRTLVFQNGLRQLPGSHIIEMGSLDSNDHSSALYHQTYLHTDFSNLAIWGKPNQHEVLSLRQSQWSQNSSSIMSWNHQGTNPYALPPLVNPYNQVNLYMNYIAPMFKFGSGGGDSLGFMGTERVGYALMTNSRGQSYQYAIDNASFKQTGIMFHFADTANRDGVTIFGNQVPSSYVMSPTMDSTLEDSRIAVFKTTGQVQLPQYISGAFEDASPLYIIAQDNEGNLVQYPPGGITPGQGLLFARDDSRNNSGGSAYFSNAGQSFAIDSNSIFSVSSSATAYLTTVTATRTAEAGTGNTSNGVAYLETYDNSSPSTRSFVNVFRDSLSLFSSAGEVRIRNLANSTTANVLYYNTTNGTVTYGAAPSVAANNGLSTSTGGTIAVLGQNVAEVGNPAILLSNREIPMGGFTLAFNASATQAVNILQTTNSAAAIRARITSAASFSNTGGQTDSEIFGEGANVTASGAVVIGKDAEATNTNTIAIGLNSQADAPSSITIGSGAYVTGSGNANVTIGANSGSTSVSGTTIVGSASVASGSVRHTLIGASITSTGGGATGVGYGITMSSSNNIAIGEQANVQHVFSQAYGFGATTTAANQLVYGYQGNSGNSGISHIYYGNGVTATSSFLFDVDMNVSGGSGTDANGIDWRYGASKGTGTGIGGAHKFQTSVPTTTGTTLQTLGDRYVIVGKYTTLTESSATSFVRVNVPTGTVAGGEVIVSVEANDGTEYQVRTLTFAWSAANKAGTTDADISTPVEVVSISSGTLTVTITIVDSGSGNVDFKADATSSLTQTVLRANCIVSKNFGVGSITAQ